MCNSKIFITCLLICSGVFFVTQAALIKPNPIISRGTGVTVKASSGDVTGLNNIKCGKYETKPWTISDNSWVAFKLASGPTKIFITFNCPDTSWSDSIGRNTDSCKQITAQYPVDYDIFTSANSTDGADKDWTKVDSIRGNTVTGRGHKVNFSSQTWIKIAIIKGKGKIDEIEIFNITEGAEDTWFFLGTKITALMLKGARNSGLPSDKSPPDSTFASMIQSRNPTFSPAIIRGGVNCGLKSGDIVRDISKYFAVAGNVHFWAIELGTFDAWGGGNTNVASFTSNLQIIIDSCKAHGIQPIIARIPATQGAKHQPAMWQVHDDYLKAVDSLAKKNTLIKGADLNWYLLNGPPGYTTTGYMDLDSKSGVLPNDYGNFELQREWVKKMDTVVYKAPPVAISAPSPAITPAAQLTALSRNGRLELAANCAGTVSFFTTNGWIIDEMTLPEAGLYKRNCAPGFYFVRFKSIKGMETVRLVNY